MLCSGVHPRRIGDTGRGESSSNWFTLLPCLSPPPALSLIPNGAWSWENEIDSYIGEKEFIIPSRYDKSENTQLWDGVGMVLFGRGEWPFVDDYSSLSSLWSYTGLLDEVLRSVNSASDRGLTMLVSSNHSLEKSTKPANRSFETSAFTGFKLRLLLSLALW